MKRELTVILIASMLSIQLYAQRKAQPGIRAGVNIANLSNINADYKTDFYVGGLLTLNLAQRYKLQPEIIYTRQGANNVQFQHEDQGPTTENVTVQYLSLGVMNKFFLADGFHLLAGPTLDLKIGKNFPRVDFDDDDYGGVDLGLALGLGYTLPIGLTIEGRFKTGLLDVFNNDYFLGVFDDSDDISLNRVFQVGISYAF